MLGELNFDQRSFINNSNHINEWKTGSEYIFSTLMVTDNSGQWQEEENLTLSFNTPQLGSFESAEKTALYVTCVKVTNAQFLSGVTSSRWTEFFLEIIPPPKAVGGYCINAQLTNEQAICNGE